MKKIPGNLLKKTWKNHGNIIEFCQSEKVGTLYCLFSMKKLETKFALNQSNKTMAEHIYRTQTKFGSR